MAISVTELFVWLLIGIFAGSLASMLVYGRGGGRRRQILSIFVGLLGAVLGGFLFRLFNIDLGLGVVSFSIQDLVSAIIGAVILLGLINMRRR